MYYFAYGSNINVDQMRARCPDAVPITSVEIKGWRLEFRSNRAFDGRGVANIIHDGRGVTNGVLWNVTDKCIGALDGFEGHPNVYKRTIVKVSLYGEEFSAITYAMPRKLREKRNPKIPSQEYLNRIAAGYEAFGIGYDRLVEAFDHSVVEYETSQRFAR